MDPHCPVRSCPGRLRIWWPRGSIRSKQFEPRSLLATANSAVSVNLAWAAVPNASSYLIEAKYGSGDFFELAKLDGEATSYTHFVVPNSKELTYQLSAVTASGNQQIGTATVSMPQLSPNPVVITELMPFLPSIGGGDIDFSTMPTIDPVNPDPNAMATMMAMAEAFANVSPEELLAELEPISATQTIGPEGGTIEVTDPNEVVYLLEVPAGLMENETTFNLQPFESMSGSPFSELLGSVQVSPPIEFTAPLRLTITLPEPPSNGKVVAFDHSHFDGEFSLVPVFQVGNVFTMNVYWGDLVGIATADPDEILAQSARIPTDAAAQISQQIAVIQALSADTSPEAFAAIMNQIFEGLFLPVDQTGYQLSSDLLAAPAERLQRGSESGMELWRRISALARWWNERWDPDYESNRAVRAAKLGEVATEIKNFLDTHTGCRTRDEFYAQAFLNILQGAGGVRSPAADFQTSLAETYSSMFGAPEDLKHCSFNLHVVSSNIVIEDANQKTTLRVHVDPFEMIVAGYGDQLHLSGGGYVVYDVMTEVIKKCGPTLVKLTPPSAAYFFIADLRPIFDDELKVVDFQLFHVQTTGSYARKATAETGEKCGHRQRSPRNYLICGVEPLLLCTTLAGQKVGRSTERDLMSPRLTNRSWICRQWSSTGMSPWSSPSMKKASEGTN